MRVVRPVVRSFTRQHAARAAAYVRSGGHAVVWETPSRALLVVPEVDWHDYGDLGMWSILDLGKQRVRSVKRGAFRGLTVTRVPEDAIGLVQGRAERDSAFAGPKRTLDLDCLACGACCVKNEVILERKDITRFRRGGREDLLRPPYTRRKDGKLVLVLARGGRCKHLARDNKCGIYEMRPEMCRIFPPGSECCLGAREDELGWRDGRS
jgi:hypothetical protein